MSLCVADFGFAKLSDDLKRLNLYGGYFFGFTGSFVSSMFLDFVDSVVTPALLDLKSMMAVEPLVSIVRLTEDEPYLFTLRMLIFDDDMSEVSLGFIFNFLSVTSLLGLEFVNALSLCLIFFILNFDSFFSLLLLFFESYLTFGFF